MNVLPNSVYCDVFQESQPWPIHRELCSTLKSHNFNIPVLCGSKELEFPGKCARIVILLQHVLVTLIIIPHYTTTFSFAHFRDIIFRPCLVYLVSVAAGNKQHHVNCLLSYVVVHS